MIEVKNYEWILRIGLFVNFFVHGIFALIAKQSWISYFTSVGFSESVAVTLLPLIGIMDIVVAIFILFKPFKIILVWATAWAFITALIRPLSGESIWEFIERSSNWIVPLALLAIQGFPKKVKDFFKI